MNKIFLIMLLFVPIAIIGNYAGLSPILTFFLSALAVIPLAKYIGEATDELAIRTGPALGGLLNATFGNATELIIGLIAIRSGLLEVVKASITGSIIGNLLLVLGTAMIAGGSRNKIQSFNKTAALASASTLLLAVIALVIPAIFVQTGATNAHLIEELSVFVSIFLVIAYMAGLLFSLRTHKHLYVEEVGEYEARWSKTRSLTVLIVATAFVGWVSEILVGSIEPLVEVLGWTQLFIGVIFVAIIGNAAEHTSAIVMALKNKMDLALQISIGSATQIAMFVAPILVFSSLFLGKPMSLIFNTFELVAIVLSVFITNLIVEDGESNWLEGLQLLMAYAIMAVAFFFH